MELHSKTLALFEVMTMYDVYDEAHVLANKLGEMGLVDRKKSLEDAIAQGFTSTEILMALRWNLQNLNRDAKSRKLALPAEIEEDVKTLLQQINILLK